jgi:NADH-quinone oxidoreductase subunit E
VEKLEKQQLEEILTPDIKESRRLIFILQEVQRRLGYVPKEAMLEIADFLDIPGSTVWGIASFYNQFRFTPPGKHAVSVCMGTACHLAGGKLVMEAMARELDIEVGEVSEDREFSLDRVACIGCCALAPVVTVGEAVYPRMTPPKVEEVLVSIKPATSEQPKQK